MHMTIDSGDGVVQKPATKIYVSSRVLGASGDHAGSV